MHTTLPTLAAAALLLLTGALLGYIGLRRGHRRRTAPRSAPLPPPRPGAPPVPPLWYRAVWRATMEATTTGRPAEAVRLGRELVDASTRAFGAEHAYTRWAWQRLTAAYLADTLIDPVRPGAPREP
ncbi:hypothetical protein ACFC26_22045 [Kitasatospora purpeofusca]|uniref:hypothetical protein n=1 Tax=Kitasatospora purpeofusca TaxID=67352 RepID=UPI0035D9E654